MIILQLVTVSQSIRLGDIYIYIYVHTDAYGHTYTQTFINSAIMVKLLVFLCESKSIQVWNACKANAEDSEQPNHEMDVLSGHENDVNYVQFRFVFPGTLTLFNELNLLLITVLSHHAVAAL